MDIAAFVFAGGILLMGVAIVVIFRENRLRTAQLAGRGRDLAVNRARRPVAGEALAVRRMPTVARAGRRPFLEPEIRDCGASLCPPR